MSFTAAADAQSPTPRLSIETLRGALLWLMGFAGAFVFIEPSPYEIVGALAIVIFALTGLTLRAPLVPLILLLVLLNLGYATAMLQVVDQSKVVTWVLVSAYLAVTAMFYAAMLGANTQARLDWLMQGMSRGGACRIARCHRSLFPSVRRALRSFPALWPRARHLQRPERARRLPGAARAARVPAHADGTAVGRAQRRHSSDRDARGAVSLVLARGLGPVRLRGAAA